MTGDERERRSRRRLLRALGAGLTGLAATNAAAAQEGDAAVLFTDQTIDGVAIRIAAVRTAIDVTYTVRSLDTGRTLAEGTFNAGTRRRGVTIRLDEQIERDQTLSISLSRPEDGSPLISDTAEVAVLGDTSEQTGANATAERTPNEIANDETTDGNATVDEVVEVDEQDAADADGQGALSDEESDVNGRDADTPEADEEGENEDAPADSRTPGFGVGAALASVGGLAYALARRPGDDVGD
ncbi:hypothetical protein ACFQDG_04435 [Natronoarchaeum mannanilyticum]|uniref:PGF-CTERM sorting domain-containing protein n=1 Tax=Natronoarchaeum mannanilyticum TaxID=926360 RepID=A0AAV3TBH7_9EURY